MVRRRRNTQTFYRLVACIVIKRSSYMVLDKEAKLVLPRRAEDHSTERQADFSHVAGVEPHHHADLANDRSIG